MTAKDILEYARGGAKSPAWTRKAGKNPKGGLNAKGRASYNRATGGNLKAPSKKKGNKRRSSFCSRMCGMKQLEIHNQELINHYVPGTAGHVAIGNNYGIR